MVILQPLDLLLDDPLVVFLLRRGPLEEEGALLLLGQVLALDLDDLRDRGASSPGKNDLSFSNFGSNRFAFGSTGGAGSTFGGSLGGSFGGSFFGSCPPANAASAAIRSADTPRRIRYTVSTSTRAGMRLRQLEGVLPVGPVGTREPKEKSASGEDVTLVVSRSQQLADGLDARGPFMGSTGRSRTRSAGRRATSTGR